MLRIPFLQFVFALNFVLVGVGCGRSGPLTAPRFDAEISAELRALSRVPLRPSPNGQYIIHAASKPDSPYGLAVLDTNGRQIAEIYSQQPLLRATWRPDSKVIAYFSQQRDGQRHLQFWDLAVGSHTRVPTPVTHHQYEVKWSNNSEFLAFNSDGRELVIVQPGGLISRIPGDFRTFAWAPDSKTIIAAPYDRSRSELQLIDVSKGVVRSRSLDAIWIIHNIEWAPHAQPLVRASNPQKSVSGLLHLNPVGLEVVRSIQLQGNISEPRWDPAGSRLLWTEQEAGSWRQLVMADVDGSVIHRYKHNGHLDFREFHDNGNTVVASLVSPSRYDLVQLNLSEPDTQTKILAAAKAISEPSATYFQQVLSRADHHFTIDIARSNISQVSPPAAVIRMLGGPLPQYAANWGERQLYLRHGIHYITVPNLGEEAVNDLIQTCDFVQKTLGVSSKRTVVYGTSTAASIALNAVTRNINAAGVVAIVGISEPPRELRAAGLPNVRLLAFHGGKDPFHPDKARRLLHDSVGREMLRPPRGIWHVFPGEVHALQAADSVVHATILAELDVLD